MTIIQGLIASIVTAAPPPAVTPEGVLFSNDNAYTWSLYSSPNYPSYSSGSLPGGSGSWHGFGGNEYMLSPFLGNMSTICINYWFYPTAYNVILVTEQGQQEESAGYNCSLLELDNDGYVKAGSWPQHLGPSPNTSTAPATLNSWNHIYFYSNGSISHLELNGVAATDVNVTRDPPGNTVIGVGSTTGSFFTTSNRFQGLEGRLEVDSSVVSSTYSSSKSLYQGLVPTGAVFESNVTPASGSTWSAITGDSALINGDYSIVGTAGEAGSGVTINGGHIAVPVTLNRTAWTVELVCSLSPTGYWATMWGNENFSESKGYLAYLGSSTNLNVGSPTSAGSLTLSDSLSDKAHWVFTNDNGTLSVYRNGTQLTVGSGFGMPSVVPANNLLVGARHQNNGIGATDTTPGTYYYIKVRDTAVSSSDVTTAYNSLKSTYNLP